MYGVGVVCCFHSIMHGYIHDHHTITPRHRIISASAAFPTHFISVWFFVWHYFWHYFWASSSFHAVGGIFVRWHYFSQKAIHHNSAELSQERLSFCEENKRSICGSHHSRIIDGRCILTFIALPFLSVSKHYDYLKLKSALYHHETICLYNKYFKIDKYYVALPLYSLDQKCFVYII